MAPAAALVFAGKSVATAAISSLVNKAFTYLIEYRKAEAVEETKKRILQALPKIQTVLDVVNPAHIKEESSALDAWLWQLRDAVEEAEDALDEIEYYELKEKAKDRKVGDWGSSFGKMKHKAVKHVSSLSKPVKGLTQCGTLKRLGKAVEGLDKAARSVGEFFALAEHLKGCASNQEEHLIDRDRETGDMLTAIQVFGRHKEKELLIGWLTNISDQDAEIEASSNHLSVVSIVGHGGMGKTTLAQLICQDDGVKQHFEKVIWACVSTSFSATTVISKILESATWEKPNANTLVTLQNILRKRLNSVKFLLILDDVWEDKNDDQWKNLFAPLRTEKRGSKILLTTRMQSVADLAAKLMGGEHQCLSLHGLEEDENINLFNHHAFSSFNLQDFADLQSIGEQIAKRVSGCPLVTKVIGAHLREHMTFQYWNIFLHQGLEHFEGNTDGIMKVLKLSYYHLSTELQTCFRYCSIFPQDTKFEKEELVEMWMSSGLISQPASGTQRLLDIGEQYLFQLTRKSFFDLRFTQDHLGRINEEAGYYVMHDLMHDLAQYVSSGECARIVDVASFENVVSTVRHIRVEDIDNLPVEEIKKISHLTNLRTIIIGHQDEVKKDILNKVEEVVESSKSLRLLATKLFHTSNFLDKLAELKHLRYIELEVKSPRSICGIVKLYHLRKLYCAVDIEPKQFKDLGNLDRLRYVDYGSYGLGNFPVGRLTSLQVLNHYQVQGAKGYTISALKDLTSLRKLGLEGLENVDNDKVAKDAKLKEKQYLNSLSLGWLECNGDRSRTNELILDNLEPHANLKELQISGYDGTGPPNWIAKLNNLVKLEVESCPNWEQLPSLVELRMLKHLKLENLPKLKKIGQPLNAPSSSEFTELSLPPSLHTLVVTHCPELRELPLLPPSLLSLKTTHVGLTNLPTISKPQRGNAGTESSQLFGIIVTSCPCLTSLGSLLTQKQYMGALKVLDIKDCLRLESGLILSEEMNELREVRIIDCPDLKMPAIAEDRLLPLSIRQLCITNCGYVASPMLGSLHGLANLTDLTLKNCSDLIFLPPAEVFKSLKSLKSIQIIGCENLSSLGGLGSLPSLAELQISNCSKLAEVGSSGGEEEHSTPLQIHRLGIDLPSLLLVQPLKSLCHTRTLNIQDGSNMENLPEQWLLQNRASLQSLGIDKIRSLESLPPSNSELERKSREYGSKIAHIHRVRLGHSYFIMGKECSEETYYRLWDADNSMLSSWLNQPKDDVRVEPALHWLKKRCCLENAS